MRLGRRHVLAAGLLVPLHALAKTCGLATPPQTAGPFFTPDSPLRADLMEAGSAGRRLVLAGRVLNERCEPQAGALVDLWHADEKGVYDNQGYRYRGHVFADAQGRFRFETIVPARYAGRTPHYHVKVQRKGGQMLTTQLYFPGEPANRRDFLYRPELEMRMEGDAGVFDFVVA